MDWAKAKTILIVTFILLNVFLITTIIYTNSNLRFQSDYKYYAKEYLESRNIQIESSIPEAGGNAGIINYSNRDFDFDQLTHLVFGHKVSQDAKGDAILYKEGDEEITLEGNRLFIKDILADGSELLSDSDAFTKGITHYLDALGYTKDTLSLQSVEESEGTMSITYVRKYNNMLLFDQVISAKLDQDGVLTVTLNTREARRSKRPGEIVSAYQVLVMSNLPFGTHIKSIDFGYKQIGLDELYGSPVWCVKIDDGSTIFFNADTGVKLQ